MFRTWEYAILTHANLLSTHKGLEGQDQLGFQHVKPSPL
jgi:hypothetical protein